MVCSRSIYYSGLWTAFKAMTIWVQHVMNGWWYCGFGEGRWWCFDSCTARIGVGHNFGENETRCGRCATVQELWCRFVQISRTFSNVGTKTVDFVVVRFCGCWGDDSKSGLTHLGKAAGKLDVDIFWESYGHRTVINMNLIRLWLEVCKMVRCMMAQLVWDKWMYWT